MDDGTRFLSLQEEEVGGHGREEGTAAPASREALARLLPPLSYWAKPSWVSVLSWGEEVVGATTGILTMTVPLKWVPWLVGGMGECSSGLYEEEVGEREDGDLEGVLGPRRPGIEEGSPRSSRRFCRRL